MNSWNNGYLNFRIRLKLNIKNLKGQASRKTRKSGLFFSTHQPAFRLKLNLRLTTLKVAQVLEEQV